MNKNSRFAYYKKGYKYQLSRDYRMDVGITGINAYIVTSNLATLAELTETGLLAIWAGYAWNGTSGPVPDTSRNMRASLVHDALYQLMREGQLPQKHRPHADELFRQMCKEDGLGFGLPSVYKRALDWFGGGSAAARNQRKEHRAP